MEEDAPWVLLTQELLGPYVTKPKLQGNRLQRPPFRFLWDIALAVETSPYWKHLRFGDKLFFSEQSPSTKEEKVEFLQRWFDLVNERLADQNEPTIEMDPNKVVCGSQCEGTNFFLQSLSKLMSPFDSQCLSTTTPLPDPAPTLLAQYLDDVIANTAETAPVDNEDVASRVASPPQLSGGQGSADEGQRLAPEPTHAGSPKLSLSVPPSLSFQDALEKFNELNVEFARTGAFQKLPKEESELLELDEDDQDPFLKAQRLLMVGIKKEKPLEDDQVSLESMEECPPSPRLVSSHKNSVCGRAQDLLDEIDRELDDVEAAAAKAKEKVKKEKQKEGEEQAMLGFEPFTQCLERPKSPNTTQNTSFFSRSPTACHQSESSSSKSACKNDMRRTMHAKRMVDCGFDPPKHDKLNKTTMGVFLKDRISNGNEDDTLHGRKWSDNMRKRDYSDSDGNCRQKQDDRKTPSKFPKSKRSQPPRAITGQYDPSPDVDDSDGGNPNDGHNDNHQFHVAKYPKSKHTQPARCIAASPSPSISHGSTPTACSLSPIGCSAKPSKALYPMSKNTDRRPRAVASTADPVVNNVDDSPTSSESHSHDSTNLRKKHCKYPRSKNAQPPRCVAATSCSTASQHLHHASHLDNDHDSDEECTDDGDVGAQRYPVSRTEVHGGRAVMPSPRFSRKGGDRTATCVQVDDVDGVDVTLVERKDSNNSSYSTQTQQGKHRGVETQAKTRKARADGKDVGVEDFMEELKSRLYSGWLPYLLHSLPRSLSEKHDAATVIGCLQIIAKTLGIQTAVDECVRDLVVRGLLVDPPSLLMGKFDDHEELIEGLQTLVQAVTMPNPLPAKLQCAPKPEK